MVLIKYICSTVLYYYNKCLLNLCMQRPSKPAESVEKRRWIYASYRLVKSKEQQFPLQQGSPGSPGSPGSRCQGFRFMDVGSKTVSKITQQQASINLTGTATHTRDDIASIFKVNERLSAADHIIWLLTAMCTSDRARQVIFSLKEANRLSRKED